MILYKNSTCPRIGTYLKPIQFEFPRVEVNTLHTYTNSAIRLYIHDYSVHIFVYYSHIKNDKFYNKNSPYWLYLNINNYISKDYLNIQAMSCGTR